MPDIIEQLEKGKELLENGDIDIESLKTKITSEEEINNIEEKPKRKIKKTKEDNASDNINSSIDASNNSSTPTEPEVKEEKYPGFDFSTEYEKGQTIFYVRINRIIGEKELMELKIRTVYPKMLVCCMDKACTQCIGPETADRIFRTRYEAVDCYNNTPVEIKTYESVVEEDDE
jgi:hypothetical protein